MTRFRKIATFCQIAIVALAGVVLLAQSGRYFVGPGDHRSLELGADGATYMEVAPGGVITARNSASLSGFTQASSILTTPTINGAILGTFDTYTAASYAAGNYTASAGNWTVADADENITYELPSTNLLILHVTLNTTTVSATPQGLRMLLPASKTCPASDVWLSAYQANDNGTAKTGIALCPANQTYIEFRLETEGNWAAATDTTYIRGSFVIPVV